MIDKKYNKVLATKSFAVTTMIGIFHQLIAPFMIYSSKCTLVLIVQSVYVTAEVKESGFLNNLTRDDSNIQRFDGNKYISSVLEKLYIDKFDRYIRPNYKGLATKVNVSVTIASFGELNAVNKAIPMYLVVRQSWHDYRYRHNETRPIIPSVASEHPSEYMWIPDTDIFNTRYSEGMHEDVLNADMLRIRNDGKISLASEVAVLASCDMEFHRFPFDTQVCQIIIESYSYSSKHLIYQFEEESALIFNSLDIPQFILTNYRLDNKSHEFEKDRHSTLLISIEIKRRVIVKIISIFFPSVAVVSVSWISLWIDKKYPAARVGIGVTTILTLTGIWTHSHRDIPRVNYLKAIDVYFMASFFFILMTLIEYAVVSNINFPLWKMENLVSRLRKSVPESPDKTNFTKTVCELQIERYYKTNSVCLRSLKNDLNSASILTSTNHYVNTNGKPRVQEKVSNCHDSDEDSSEDEGVTNIIEAHLHNPKTSTLDIISRFLFPFFYICFQIYFWKSNL